MQKTDLCSVLKLLIFNCQLHINRAANCKHSKVSYRQPILPCCLGGGPLSHSDGGDHCCGAMEELFIVRPGTSSRPLLCCAQGPPHCITLKEHIIMPPQSPSSQLARKALHCAAPEELFIVPHLRSSSPLWSSSSCYPGGAPDCTTTE